MIATWPLVYKTTGSDHMVEYTGNDTISGLW